MGMREPWKSRRIQITVPLVLDFSLLRAWKLAYWRCFMPERQYEVLISRPILKWASLVAQTVKNSPAMWKTWVRFLGWEDSLEKGSATHSSILAWRIPWTEELYSPWGHKESDTTEQLSLDFLGPIHSLTRLLLLLKYRFLELTWTLTLQEA